MKDNPPPPPANGKKVKFGKHHKNLKGQVTSLVKEGLKKQEKDNEETHEVAELLVALQSPAKPNKTTTSNDKSSEEGEWKDSAVKVIALKLNSIIKRSKTLLG